MILHYSRYSKAAEEATYLSYPISNIMYTNIYWTYLSDLFFLNLHPGSKIWSTVFVAKSIGTVVLKLL